MLKTEASSAQIKAINILGIRGLPAAHGGFETFAARLAQYLRDHNWAVTVYCQIEPDAEGRVSKCYHEDEWEGIRRVHIGGNHKSSTGSVVFDWLCVRDVLSRPGVDLTLGYNTAIFTILQRLRGRQVFMNMDGIEWKRAKWSPPIKAWFYLNEFIGSNISNVPIADHPEIARHLRRHGIRHAVVIPYGADAIESAPEAPVRAMGFEPKRYLASIARIEPENSILEIVRCFSKKQRGVKLVVLGKLDADNRYHSAVRAAASDEVVFPGAIYEKEQLAALRYHVLAYVHGHQVGGTNPSLVEALGAGNAIIAHDNRFNRWVAGDSQFYFSSDESLSRALDVALSQGDALGRARLAARARHRAQFTWDRILADYERVLGCSTH
jgi:glycosyltransferase involved in cell wall biosynthesis